MRFEFLKEHRGEIGPIKKACGLMKVSKSGFYEYLGRRKSNAQIEREALEGFVVEAFERHKGRYGYRRINRELRKSGIVVSEKRVLRIMRKLGLAGRGATRKRCIQKKVEPGDPRLNLVERAFAVGGRNRLWVGDITYIPTRGGVALPRGRDRRLLPQGRGLANVRAHHREGRDRRDGAGGRQGGSARRRRPRLPWRPGRAVHLPFPPAMSGLAWHGPVGIKARHAAGQRGGRVVLQDAEKGTGGRKELWDEAKQDIFKYIELYYNRVRMHSTLDYMSPVEYERQYA